MKLYKHLIIIPFLFYSIQGVAKDFYVASNGSDTANGLSPQTDTFRNGPFLTLARAQQAVRDLKTQGEFTEPVNIHIANGIYKLEKTLTFDLRDSGVVDREITWLADDGGAIISGGIPLTRCENTLNNLWQCDLANLDVKNIKYQINSRKKNHFTPFNLYVDEHRFHLARWPDTDWAHIKSAMDEKTRFTSMEQLPAMNDTDTQIHIFAGNDWFDEFIPVTTTDKEKNEIILSKPTTFPLVSGRRFYLQNILSQLNVPEEWFYDKEKQKILFKTANQEAPKSVIISSLANLFSLDNANYINFKKLTLKHSSDNAIIMEKSSHILIEQLEINNIDALAIQAEQNHDITIKNNYIHDIGEAGIYISGGDRKTLVSANNIIDNNTFLRFANAGILSYTPAIQMEGVGGLISHNLIAYGAGNAILIAGNEHVIEKNEISHVCEQASDCGAIYDGRNWTDRGNIVRFNSFHDIHGYRLQAVNATENTVNYAANGAVGVYLDDALSGWRIYGNIFNHLDSIAIQVGGGRNNFIENNLFYDVDCAICVDARWPDFSWAPLWRNLRDSPYLSPIWRTKYPELTAPMLHENWPEANTIRHNVMVAGSKSHYLMQYVLPETDTTISDNLVWAATSQVKVLYNVLDKYNGNVLATWEDWLKLGVEKNSWFADPCVTINGNRLIFCNSSPIDKIGFQRLPDDIGKHP